MNRRYLIVAFFIMLLGCKANLEEKIIYKGENYYLKTVHKNGRLKSEQQFFKNKYGKMVARGFYKIYYDNGALDKEMNLFDDKIMGNQIKYDEKGKEKHIIIMSERGSPFFEMVRDDKGLIKTTGIPWHLNRPANPVKKGDDYIFYYGIVTTQNLQSKLIRKFTNPSGKVTSLDTITDFAPVKKEFFIEKTIFIDTGNYLLTIDVTLFERSNSNILAHSQIIDAVYVKD